MKDIDSLKSLLRDMRRSVATEIKLREEISALEKEAVLIRAELRYSYSENEMKKARADAADICISVIKNALLTDRECSIDNKCLDILANAIRKRWDLKKP